MAEDFGLRQTINSLMDEMEKVQRLEKAKKEGKPIDIQEAKDIIKRFDDFVDMFNKIPGMNLLNAIPGKSLYSIQRKAHKWLIELEEQEKKRGDDKVSLEANQ